MRPISNTFGGVGVTALFVLIGGLLASKVPVSVASAPETNADSNQGLPH